MSEIFVTPLDEAQKRAIPQEDFISEAFDSMPPPSPTRKILLLVSTPRSGSTLISDILFQNDVCLMHEYFQPYQYLPMIAERWKCIKNGQLDLETFALTLMSQRTHASGWLGINIHASHLRIFDEIRPFFGNIPIFQINLIRRDKVGQAISYAIAAQSGKWSTHFQSQAEPRYSFEDIEQRYFQLCAQEEVLKNHRFQGITRQTEVCYEDIEYRPDQVLREMSDILNFRGQLIFKTSLTRQRSETTDRWREQFIKDLGSKYIPNPSGNVKILTSLR